jgi:DNA gyrase/topoisomerase IV subunit B
MMNEATIRAIHNHVIEGTVTFDPIRNKQICVINTRGVDGQFDGNTRTLATSDLHQTFWTVEVKKELDRLKAKARRASRASTKVVKADQEEVVILDEENADELATLRALVNA